MHLPIGMAIIYSWILFELYESRKSIEMQKQIRNDRKYTWFNKHLNLIFNLKFIFVLDKKIFRQRKSF